MNRDQQKNEGFICPITQEIMNDPVIADDGISYERQAIVDWLKVNNTSPITRQPMSKRLQPNNELKKQIEKNSKYIQFQETIEILNQPLIGNYNQREKIKQNQINELQKLQVKIKDKDDNLKRQIINSGIVDALLRILLTRDLDQITNTYPYTFYLLTCETSDEITLLLIPKNPFPALLRLFNHQDDDIVSNALSAIHNIFVAGSNKTSLTSPHHHFEIIQQSDGMNKIFQLFNKNINKKINDNSAICISYLFRAREITNAGMRRDIISHIISLLVDSDDHIRKSAKHALNRLKQNRDEIMKYIDLTEMNNQLNKRIEGNKQQRDQILMIQDRDCLLLKLILQNKDDNLKRQIINSGNVDALLRILLTRDLDQITNTYSYSFYLLTCQTSDEIALLLIPKNPFPALLRLFNHQDDDIVSNAIITIYNILAAGSNTTSLTSPHPHFEIIQQSDGINKIFQLFNKNINKKINDNSAICISYLFRAREITNAGMRRDIISHIISLLVDSDDWTRKSAQYALECLKQNRGMEFQ